jgi:hypothetical protein
MKADYARKMVIGDNYGPDSLTFEENSRKISSRKMIRTNNETVASKREYSTKMDQNSF